MAAWTTSPDFDKDGYWDIVAQGEGWCVRKYLHKHYNLLFGYYSLVYCGMTLRVNCGGSNRWEQAIAETWVTEEICRNAKKLNKLIEEGMYISNAYNGKKWQ